MDRRHLPLRPERVVIDVAETVEEQVEAFPEPWGVTAPEGAPNVLVILIDDMGFGASSAFGGPCEMPVAEELAAGGLSYNRFHTTAICSPTRAALLTGRNHHTVGMGNLANFASNVPGYTTMRGPEMGTIAQALRHNGYATGAFGKWHQTPQWELGAAGPFDRWPTGEGFERFYGIMGGESSQFTPVLYDGTTPIDLPATEADGYHLSEDLVDQMTAWVGSVRRISADKPWFSYLSFGATHAPFHLPKELRGRHRGEFAHGWNVQREITLARQKELGLAPADTELAPWTPGVPLWEDLSDVEKEAAERLMEAYASFAEHTDAQVGRALDFLRETGELDNTLLLYILGDNGAAAEGGLAGSLNEMLAINNLPESAERIVAQAGEIGGPTTYPAYPVGWAVAMNAPFQWTKQVASHFGGTRNGMIVHWPAGITDAGGLREQFTHVIDVVPTILEAAGLPQPETLDGVPQHPMEGISFHHTFASAEAEDRHTTQYFEIMGSRGIYHEGWTAVTQHRLPWAVYGESARHFKDDVWELYDTTNDWAQSRDLAAELPDKLAELQALFLDEARKYQVLPMDDRLFRPPVPGLPGLPVVASRAGVTLTPGDRNFVKEAMPQVINASHRVAVQLDADTDTSDGVLVAMGGSMGGWALHLVEGRVQYVHNRCGLDWQTVSSLSAVPAGRHQLDFVFRFDGGAPGAGGDVELYLDGAEFGGGRLTHTTPFIYSTNEGTNVGIDRGSPVCLDYARGSGNPYSGTVLAVTVTSGEDAIATSPADALRIELAHQ